jgi:hypothetical protein
MIRRMVPHVPERAATVTGRNAAAALALVGVVVVTARWLWSAPGTPDVDIWLDWIRTLSADGPVSGYRAIAADYPPGASFLLWTAASLGAAVWADARTTIKVLLFAFLIGNTLVTLVATRRVSIAFVTYASMVMSAIGLMYLDILIAPLVTGAIWAAWSGAPMLMAGLLVAAATIKWQPLIVLPFAAIHVWRHAGGPRSASFWLRCALVLAPALVAIAIYGPAVVESLYRASRHGSLSSFAANFPWLMTWWMGAGSETREASGGVITILPASRLTLRVLSLAMLIAYGGFVRAYWKRTSGTVNDWLLFSLLGYWAYCVISAGAHENHLFLASLLALGLWWRDPRRLPLALMLAALANLNLAVFYGWMGYTTRFVVAGLDPTVILALANCVLFGGVVIRTFRPSVQP